MNTCYFLYVYDVRNISVCNMVNLKWVLLTYAYIGLVFGNSLPIPHETVHIEEANSTYLKVLQ